MLIVLSGRVSRFLIAAISLGFLFMVMDLVIASKVFGFPRGTAPAVPQLLLTARFLGRALLLGLPLGLLLGIPAGHRLNSWWDRALQGAASYLLGVPVVGLAMLMIYLIVVKRAGNLPIAAGADVAVALALGGWLARALRDGLAGARQDGRLLPGRAAMLVFGRLGQRFGSCLLVVLWAEYLGLSRGAYKTMITALEARDLRMFFLLFAVLAGVGLVTRFAGNILVALGERAEQPPSRLRVSWVAVGAVLACVLVAGALISFDAGTALDLPGRLKPPGPGHLLGTDFLGRDWAARLAGATRRSLGVGMGAAMVALIGGLVWGTVGRFTGSFGRWFISPRLPLPDLYLPFCGGLVAAVLGGKQPYWPILISLGICAVPSMAYPWRRVWERRDRPAVAGLAGAVLLVLAQSLTVEIMLGMSYLFPVTESPTLGQSLSDLRPYLRQSGAAVMAHLALLAGIGGLALAGQGLLESAGSEEHG